MIKQDLFTLINKIDSDLKCFFENVKIEETVNKGNYYFDIKVDNLFFITESLSWKRFSVNINIDKKSLNSDLVSWSYSTNPLKESAMWIDRKSPISNLASDVYNIITKSMMEKEYFELVKEEVEFVNESTSQDFKNITIEESISKTLSDYINILNIEKEDSVFLENNLFMNKKSDFKLKVYTDTEIKTSTKFILETLLTKSDFVNFVIFKEGYLEIDVTPV